jgi:predicted GNAT family acetyltransferase
LALAHRTLADDPVRSNVVLTVLHARVSHPAAGRYWVVSGRDGAVGVVLQSPLDFIATLTPMDGEAVVAVVDAIAAEGVHLPGVNGEAATAARFAGRWAEGSRSAAVPEQGQRIYEVREVRPPPSVGGALRPAALAERDLLVEWLRGFHADTGEAGGDPAAVVDVRLPAGHLWIWDDDGPVSLAALSEPVHGVSRVQAVYTPHGFRGRGYGSACVAAVSEAVLEDGRRCILYTDLGNRTSNGIYRDIGFQAVAEGLRYRFA